MNRKTATDNSRVNSPAFDHAVVIGSSIAGLTAARVLTDHFDRVTIIERDRLPDPTEFRHGVPQARHAHTLKPRGQMALEQLFPGLVDELLANGAISINPNNEVMYYESGDWHSPRERPNTVSAVGSRPLLDTVIYRHLVTHSGVTAIQEHEVVGLSVNQRGERVTGVRMRGRGESVPEETNLTANLVVDASGRGSQAPQWLESLGYTPPLESRVNPFSGYATRIYQHPATFVPSWKSLYILPTPPYNTRGGIIIPIEENRWHVTLIGMAGDYPPTNENGFLDFARSLPTQRLYETIKNAKPLSKPYGYRGADDHLRHYEKLPRYLEGFLVFGDAVYTLNPVYALGITVAALGSLALDRCLWAQRRQGTGGDLTGLAQAFQKQLSKVVTGPWKMAVRADKQWPGAQITEGLISAQRGASHRNVAYSHDYPAAA